MSGTRSPLWKRRAAVGTGALIAALLLAVSCGRLPPPGGIGTSAPGTLVLRSNPSGAHVSIDGEPTQLRTPTEIAAVAPGEHRLSLALRGYHPWDKTVAVGGGETVNVDVRLEPSATGSLTVSSIPFMSLIFIDGRPTPHVTPATISGLPVGTHTVLIRREGYEDWSQAVVVLENRQMELKASLRPVEGLRGNLNIQTYPPKAEILIDGYPTGNRTPATIFNLLAGRHEVTLRLDGHRTWGEEVTIPEGRTSSLLVTLEHARPVTWGSAEISTQPPGARVFLNDIRCSSVTPLVFEAIVQGVHVIRIEKEGFEAWEGEMTVKAGEKTEIAVPLRFAAAPASP